MGKSSPKQKVYGYKMSITYGICHGIVSKILKIFIKEKEVFSNPCHGEVFLIDKPKIFGGLKKEGGVQGMVYFQPGDFTQLLHTDVAAKLGGTPETLPGHRGISTATFTEGTDGKYSGSKDNPGYEGPGFYWNENQPSVPPAWFMVERIGKPTVMAGHEKILRDPGSGADVSGGFALTQGATVASRDVGDDDVVADWSLRKAYISDFDTGDGTGHGIQVWDLSNLTYVETYKYPDFNGGLFLHGIDPETGYIAGQFNNFSNEVEDWVIDPSDGSVVTYFAARDRDHPTDPSLELAPSAWCIFGDGVTSTVISRRSTSTRYRLHTFPGLLWIKDVDGPDVPGDEWQNTGMVAGASGEAWGAWVRDSRMEIVKFSLADGAVVETFLPEDIDARASEWRWTTQNWQPFYDPSDGAVIWPLSLSSGSPDFNNFHYYMKWHPDSGIIWKVELPEGAEPRQHEVSSINVRLEGDRLVYPVFDVDYTRPVVLVDLKTGSMEIVDLDVPYAQDYFWWDDVENCGYNFAGMEDDPETELALRRFCTNSCDAVFDMNPIHIIAECLTDGVWGRGLPDTAINASNFQAAAKTLFDEGFGLSMIWTEKEEIEKFIQEVIDHIEATLYINPRNGLFEVKLIRDDYDESTLREVHPGNAVVTKFSRRQTTEIVNEIVLQWTNPDTEKLESLTIQDLGAIVAAGQVNSDGRNYYGIHKRDLAAKVLSRDIRSSASPLAVAEVEADRTFWDVIPGEPIKLWYPEYDIAENDPVIMRVMTVNYGKPGSSKIKLKLAEDVFSLTGQALEAPAVTEHDDTPVTPTEADDVRLLTLPYYLTYNFVDPASLSNVVYPEVFVGVLAAEADPAIEFELHGEVVDAAGNTSFDLLDVLGFIAQGTLPADLAWEAESAITGLAATTQGAGPEAGGLMLIAADGDTDATAELVLLVSKSGDTWTVRRGVLDTVPRAWPAGTKVWFLSQNDDYADDTIRTAADVLDYKVLPRTNGGTLAFADAAIEQITTSERPWLPSRPADVAVNGVRFADAVYTTKPATVDITWADRNRETENAQILAWGDAGVTPETGQTVEVDVFDDALTLLHTFTGLTGGSASLDETEFSQTTSSIVRVYAARDGLRSLQYYQTGVDTRGGIGWGEDWGNDWGGTAV